MAAAVRNCAGLTRALARSGTGIRLLAARGNTGAVPTTLLRKLTTSSSWRAGRSEEEINKWVETELSRGWESKGVFDHDRWRDNIAFHLMGISLFGLLIGLTWIWRYAGDMTRRHWATREAYLVLAEREALNLDPVSRDYVDPDKIELPTDEELGDMPILI